MFDVMLRLHFHLTSCYKQSSSVASTIQVELAIARKIIDDLSLDAHERHGFE